MKFSHSNKRGKSTASAAQNNDVAGTFDQGQLNQLWQQIDTEGHNSNNGDGGSSIDNSLMARGKLDTSATGKFLQTCSNDQKKGHTQDQIQYETLNRQIMTTTAKNQQECSSSTQGNASNTKKKKNLFSIMTSIIPKKSLKKNKSRMDQNQGSDGTKQTDFDVALSDHKSSSNTGRNLSVQPDTTQYMVKNFVKAQDGNNSRLPSFIIDENHIQQPEDTLTGNIQKIDLKKYEQELLLDGYENFQFGEIEQTKKVKKGSEQSVSDEESPIRIRADAFDEEFNVMQPTRSSQYSLAAMRKCKTNVTRESFNQILFSKASAQLEQKEDSLQGLEYPSLTPLNIEHGQENITGGNVNNDTVAASLGKDESPNDTKQIPSIFEKSFENLEEKYLSKLLDDEQKLPNESNEGRDQANPIPLESFLNDHEVEVIESLNPSKKSSKSGKSGSSINLFGHSMSNNSNSNSKAASCDTPTPKSLNLSEKLIFEQQGTAISIKGFTDKDRDMKKIQGFLKALGIKPARVIQISENNEVLLSFLTMDDANNVYQHLQERTITIKLNNLKSESLKTERLQTIMERENSQDPMYNKDDREEFKTSLNILKELKKENRDKNWSSPLNDMSSNLESQNSSMPSSLYDKIKNQAQIEDNQSISFKPNMKSSMVQEDRINAASSQKNLIFNDFNQLPQPAYNKSNHSHYFQQIDNSLAMQKKDQKKEKANARVQFDIEPELQHQNSQKQTAFQQDGSNEANFFRQMPMSHDTDELLSKITKNELKYEPKSAEYHKNVRSQKSDSDTPSTIKCSDSLSLTQDQMHKLFEFHCKMQQQQMQQNPNFNQMGMPMQPQSFAHDPQLNQMMYDPNMNLQMPLLDHHMQPARQVFPNRFYQQPNSSDFQNQQNLHQSYQLMLLQQQQHQMQQQMLLQQQMQQQAQIRQQAQVPPDQAQPQQRPEVIQPQPSQQRKTRQSPDQAKSVETSSQKDDLKSPESSHEDNKIEAPKKKVLIGPKNNQVDFDRVIYADRNGDLEVLGQTTLMIRNIPIKFTQTDMMSLINVRFENHYNYFYLPKDLKTQCGVGFAFINMTHAIYILDFFLEFNGIKWSEKVEKCNSNKYCEITYANVQGLDEIKLELSDKNIMKKTEGSIKPQFFEERKADPAQIMQILHQYQNDPVKIEHYKRKCQEFNQIKLLIKEQKEQFARTQEEQRQQKLEKAAKNEENKQKAQQKQSKSKKPQGAALNTSTFSLKQPPKMQQYHQNYNQQTSGKDTFPTHGGPNQFRQSYQQQNDYFGNQEKPQDQSQFYQGKPPQGKLPQGSQEYYQKQNYGYYQNEPTNTTSQNDWSKFRGQNLLNVPGAMEYEDHLQINQGVNLTNKQEQSILEVVSTKVTNFFKTGDPNVAQPVSAIEANPSQNNINKITKKEFTINHLACSTLSLQQTNQTREYKSFSSEQFIKSYQQVSAEKKAMTLKNNEININQYIEKGSKPTPQVILKNTLKSLTPRILPVNNNQNQHLEEFQIHAHQYMEDKIKTGPQHVQQFHPIHNKNRFLQNNIKQ